MSPLHGLENIITDFKEACRITGERPEYFEIIPEAFYIYTFQYKGREQRWYLEKYPTYFMCTIYGDSFKSESLEEVEDWLWDATLVTNS